MCMHMCADIRMWMKYRNIFICVWMNEYPYVISVYGSHMCCQAHTFSNKHIRLQHAYHHMYTRTSADTYIYSHIYTHIHAYTHLHKYTYAYIDIHVALSTYIYFIHIRTLFICIRPTWGQLERNVGPNVGPNVLHVFLICG